MSIAGKNAIVTGGSRGIGAAIARALAKDGADVAISYAASKDRAEAVVEELKGDVARMEAAGVTVHPVPGEALLTVLQEASSPLLDEWKQKMPDGVGDETLAR